MNDSLSLLLFALGVGFLAANLLLFQSYAQYLRVRRAALLTWVAPRPRFFGLSLAIAAGLSSVILYKVAVLHWPLWRVFGEAMMLLYYGGAYPLSMRVRRGFYEAGIWLDRGFARWKAIGGATWRDDPAPTLIVIARARQTAWRLAVPGEHYAAARRLLRDRITTHDLHLGAGGLELGGHDPRNDV